jgi:GR25 family glycosyltransferase involved in LPS biosynthesis
MNRFILSLVNSPLRNKNFNLKTSYKFFDAISEVEPKFDIEKFRSYYGRDARVGEVGCALSHYYMFTKEFHKLESEWLFILEDDALVKKEYEKQCLSLNDITLNYPCVIVQGHSKSLFKNKIFHKLLYPVYEKVYLGGFYAGKCDINQCGTVAYAINQPASKVLSDIDMVYWLADDWLEFEKMGIKVLHLNDKLVYEDLSTLSTTGNEIYIIDAITHRPILKCYLLLRSMFCKMRRFINVFN